MKRQKANILIILSTGAQASSGPGPALESQLDHGDEGWPTLSAPCQREAIVTMQNEQAGWEHGPRGKLGHREWEHATMRDRACRAQERQQTRF